jgi:hypothetical protein
MNINYLPALLLIAFIILFATPAYANAGVPMLAIILPGMIVSLIPIILIEAWYISRSLSISFAKAIKVMGIANLESTLIGIPITWTIWVVVEMIFAYVGYHLSDYFGISLPDFIHNVFAVTVNAAWVAPNKSNAYWLLPVAVLVLLLVFCYISWLIERRRAKKLLREVSSETVNRAILIANIYSYGLLGLIVVGFFINAIITKGIS